VSTFTSPRFDTRLWPVLPFGSDDGILTEGDVLARVTHTADGVDLNTIWQTMQNATSTWNAHRTALTDLLSYWTTAPAEAVGQGRNEDEFELATELGEPESLRPPSAYNLLGFTFEDYDRAARYSWRALREMDQRQALAVHNEALNADNSLVTKTILNRLFSPAPETNSFGHTCYGLWVGSDGMIPPNWLGKSFDANHTHYRATGNAEIDSTDLLEGIKAIREHGYGLVDSDQILIALVNEAESEVIQSFRANVENNNSAVSRWDFIPSKSQPAFTLQGAGQLIGEQPEGQIFSLPTVGKYGPVFVVESSFVPEGYFSIIATAGPGNPSNCIGVRQHENTTYQGLRHLPGNTGGYPLIESFYTRSFGVGVRHRGAAVCYKLGAGPYTAPEILS